MVLAAACASSSASPGGKVASTTTTGAAATAGTLRLGFYPNITHGAALIGVKEGIFAKALGAGVTLKTQTFNAGPAEVQALFSGALDAGYMGSGPAVNAFAQSHGTAITVISGAASGGAELVVKPSITSAAALKGKKLASPQLGNTQDVALRYWLKTQGLSTDTQGGGDVSIEPQDNATALLAFRSGAIDGGWEPEPFASEMVAAGGRVLVDERSLWPGGKFATTLLVVRTQYLKEHPDVVKALLRGQVQANDFVNANPSQARADVSAEIDDITGKPLAPSVVADAWTGITFTDDPLSSSIQAAADHAVAVGIGKKVDLAGLVNVSLLNQVLQAAGEPPVGS